jgi:hypothetical protein
MRPTRLPLALVVLLLWAGVDDFCLPQAPANSTALAPCAEDDEFSVSEAECALRRSAQAGKDLPHPPGWQPPTSHPHPPAPTPRANARDSASEFTSRTCVDDTLRVHFPKSLIVRNLWH